MTFHDDSIDDINVNANFRIFKNNGKFYCETGFQTIEKIFNHEPLLDNMLLSKPIADVLQSCETGTHIVAIAAIQNGIPIPALTAALGYYNSYKSGWLPANMVQAQRDYFGAHTYELIGKEGGFHTQWTAQNN